MLLDVLGPRRMLLDLMVLSLAQAEIIDFGNDWDSRQVPTFANESPLSFAAAKAARVTANLPDDLSLAYPGETILLQCVTRDAPTVCYTRSEVHCRSSALDE